MILALFAGLALIGLSNRSPIHPGAVSFLTRTQIESLECRTGGSSPSVLDTPAPSRTANFSLRGEFDCHRPIFRSDERNPYIDRALEAESVHARRVALSLARALRDQSAPVGVRVEGVEESRLREQIAAIYRVELAAALGPGRVRHSGEEASPLLMISVRLVDVPELMSRARLRLTDKQGEITWLEI